VFASATKWSRSDSTVFSKATVQCSRSAQVPQSVFEATVQCFRRRQQSRSRLCNVLEAFKCHEAISKRQYSVFGIKAGAKLERSSLGTPRPEGKFKYIYIYVYPCTNIYIYISISIRTNLLENSKVKPLKAGCPHVCIYIYIYIINFSYADRKNIGFL